MAFFKSMIKRLLRKLPLYYYYNILTMHDVVQSKIWRAVAPDISQDAFENSYQMLFVLGCGRSGTTIFSHCLGKHRQIAELNEPLHIWFSTAGNTDILSPFASFAKGICRLNRDDVDDNIRARYRASVDYHMKRLEPAPVVCDKLPLNTFRVDYIHAICHNAKFILLQRSPRTVARSIEQCAKRDGIWWGFRDYKWQAIARYAESRPELKSLLPYATDDYYRGLIEWRVSQDLAKADLECLDPSQYIIVDYEDFIADPKAVLGTSFAFAGLEFDQEAADYAVSHVAPTSAHVQSRTSPEDDKRHALIIGDYDDMMDKAVA